MFGGKFGEVIGNVHTYVVSQRLVGMGGVGTSVFSNSNITEYFVNFFVS